MTVEEIKSHIRGLQDALKEKEQELENQKDKAVGQYYKCQNAIGVITAKSESTDEYISNELYFYDPEHGGTPELQHDTYSSVMLEDIEFITKEDFEDLFNRRIKQLRNVFELN